jgi:hypothetical protein
VIGSDLSSSKRVGSNADTDGLRYRVDVDRRLGGSRDSNVSGAAEQRFDFHDCTANANPVEQIAGPWHGDGGKHSQDTNGDEKLYDRECVSHRCSSFRQVSRLDSI